MLLHFLFIPRVYFFRWFLRLSPLCRNVYALIMNCFSARIPTELKLFNFPYFLLSLALYSQARLLLSPYISFMSACIHICVKLRFCHREPFKISAMRFTHKLHFLNLKFDEEFLSTTIQKTIRAYSRVNRDFVMHICKMMLFFSVDLQF